MPNITSCGISDLSRTYTFTHIGVEDYARYNFMWNLRFKGCIFYSYCGGGLP